jgi:DNA-binding response OmpR family regulator
MTTHAMTDDHEAVVDSEREWAVYRCSHGCLHVALDRVTLTLTEKEFHALRQLMARACQRFHRGQMHEPSDVRTR